MAERQAGTVGERMQTKYYADFGPFDGKVWLNCAHQGPLPRVAADEDSGGAGRPAPAPPVGRQGVFTGRAAERFPLTIVA